MAAVPATLAAVVVVVVVVVIVVRVVDEFPAVVEPSQLSDLLLGSSLLIELALVL